MLGTLLGLSEPQSPPPPSGIWGCSLWPLRLGDTFRNGDSDIGSAMLAQRLLFLTVTSGLSALTMPISPRRSGRTELRTLPKVIARGQSHALHPLSICGDGLSPPWPPSRGSGRQSTVAPGGLLCAGPGPAAGSGLAGMLTHPHPRRQHREHRHSCSEGR